MNKQRVIFDNYDIEKYFPDNELIENAIDCAWIDNTEEIDGDMIAQWRDFSETNWYNDEIFELKRFFADKTVIFFGNVGLWNGTFDAGKIGDFEKLYYDAIKDCEYIKIYDENGHLFIECSHHDGTNYFEIKELTENGKNYFDNWNYGTDNRTERYVHNQIIKRYSKIPHYANAVYGKI
jgi:hypothetical protein